MTKIVEMWQSMAFVALLIIVVGILTMVIGFFINLWQHIHGKMVTDSGFKEYWPVVGGLIVFLFAIASLITLVDFSVATWKHVHQDPVIPRITVQTDNQVTVNVPEGTPVTVNDQRTFK